MSQSVDMRRYPHWRFLLFTLLIALMLNLAPVPDWLQYARPDWLTLVVFYWALALPRNFGVLGSWLGGLLEDLLTYSLLGQHALGKAFTAMIAGSSNRRLKLFSRLEQTVVVFLIQSVNIGIAVWVQRLTHSDPVQLVYWQAALTTALVWPVVSSALTWLDPMPRRFG